MVRSHGSDTNLPSGVDRLSLHRNTGKPSMPVIERCLNPKCARPLPHSMQMNTTNLQQLPEQPKPFYAGICGACGRLMINMEFGLTRNTNLNETDPSAQYDA